MKANHRPIEPAPRADARGTMMCAVAVAAMLMLSGCASWPEDLRSIVAYGDDGSESSGLSDRHPEELKEPPSPAVVPKPRPDLAAADRADALPGGGAHSANPEDLIGMDEQQVRVTLGTPVAQRDVPPAKIWHYSETDCVVSVYFYLNLESQVFQALRYEIVQRPRSAVAGGECYAMLVASRRKPLASEG